MADMSTDGGAAGSMSTDGGAMVDITAGTNGGATVYFAYGGVAMSGISDLSMSHDNLVDFLSFLAVSSFPNNIDTIFLDMLELNVLRHHSFSATSLMHLYKQHFDLSKEPLSYAEAIACPDASAWWAAMDHEKESLQQMGAFEEVDLPPGKHLIGLKWVYAYKTNAEEVNIKEKACVVAQGFSQRPGQFDETYVPVAKMASICILPTWAAVHNPEIFQFDCKMAFLHAKLCHLIYAHQFLGYTLADSTKALCILVALYGLYQSAYK